VTTQFPAIPGTSVLIRKIDLHCGELSNLLPGDLGTDHFPVPGGSDENGNLNHI